MANPVAGVAYVELGGSASTRWWQLNFSNTPQAAGTAISVTLTSGTTGVAPPVAATGLTVEILGDTGSGLTSLATVTFTAIPQTKTFYLSSTPDVATGANRSGVFVYRIHATQTGGLAATQYDIRSDGTGTPPTGYTITNFNNGYIKSTTSITVDLGTTSGGATPALYGYGDTMWAKVVLGDPPIVSGPTVTVTWNGLTTVLNMVAGTATYNGQFTGVVDNRFAASSANYATTLSYSNAQGAGIGAWLVASSTTNDTATVDPRLTFSHLHQDNDNAFGTPPTSKEAGAQRLASNLGFMDARVVNANGTGINGITWTGSLQDAGALVAALTRSVTSATQGGQAGWGSTFLTWDSQLPTGTWNKTTTITAPAGATGLEVSGSATYQLVASNPNYRMVCAAGPAAVSTDARHFAPGMDLLVGLAVFDTNTRMTLTLDTSPVPSVAIGRFNLTLGRAEYLDSDGVTWLATNGATIYYHACTVSPGDSKAWTVAFSGAQTTGWGNADIFIIARAFVGGVPVNDFYKEIVVNGVNNHDKYTFDPTGLFA